MPYPSGAIPVTGTIGTTSSSDTYAVTTSELMQGGAHEVADTTARDAITVERRTFGMKVTLQNGAKLTYVLANIAMGGSSNTLTDNTNWIIDSVADATTLTKGVVQLAGDLGGTAAAPTVPTKLTKAGDTMTGKFGYSVFTLTYAATIAIDASLGNVARVTLTGNAILGNWTNNTDGQFISIEVIQDATGSRTLTYDTNYQFTVDNPIPLLTTTPNAMDKLLFQYRASTGKFQFITIAKGY